MKRKKIDNFAAYRKKAIRDGRILIHFPPFKKDGDLAELIGVVLGDGHLQKFPRTERLLIFSNTNNQGFVKRYAHLVEKIFNKKPYVYKQTGQNCTRISLYQKAISERLGVPCGARKYLEIKVPRWILAKDEYVVRYLRGLYEAEGSASFHPGTSTHKFNFSNLNQSMLENVYTLMTGLGFYLSRDTKRVQISRKDEVKRAIELLCFRDYNKR